MSHKNKNYMFIRQSAYSNYYCNMVFHIETEGGWSMPPIAITDTKFEKFGGRCNCTREEKDEFIKFKKNGIFTTKGDKKK